MQDQTYPLTGALSYRGPFPSTYKVRVIPGTIVEFVTDHDWTLTVSSDGQCVRIVSNPSPPVTPTGSGTLP